MSKWNERREERGGRREEGGGRRIRTCNSHMAMRLSFLFTVAFSSKPTF
jgi:hypothetical protein